MRFHQLASAAALSAAVLSACSEPAETARNTDPTPAPPRERVDSILSLEEGIRRFKASLPPAPDAVALEDGATSRDQLVRQFVQAVETRDSAALSRMVMNAREFIDLYYPHTKYTRPPYQLDPSIVWLLLRENSDKGLRRILQRVAGAPFGFEGYACAKAPIVEGTNRIWEACQLHRSFGDLREFRLFSAIIERDGRYKVFTYANDM